MYEIEATESSYDNTRAEAIEHVTDMLEEGQYSDALTDEQTQEALNEIRRM